MAWDELPEGWELRELGEVTRIGVPKGWKPTPYDGKIPFVEMADIDQETGLRSRYTWRNFEEVSGGKVRFAADALLVAKITPCTENNKTALVPEIPTNGGYATTEVFAVHPSMWTDRLYLLYFLRSPQVREVLVRSMTGSTGRQRVPKQALEGLEIPLPPLLEQCRIVARIEELAERIDAARRLRAEAAEEAAAILPTALEEVFEEAEERRWEIRPLGEVFTYRSELIRPSDGKAGELRFIGLQHIESHSGRRIGEDILRAEELTGRKFVFSPGQILYGSLRPYLNKVWIADCEGVCSVDQFVLEAAPMIMDTAYLAHYLRSAPFLREAMRYASTLDLPRIRRDKLVLIPIPLPSLTEQRYIAVHLDAVQAKVEAIRRYQEETREEIEAMTGAVLERAFRGGL